MNSNGLNNSVRSNPRRTRINRRQTQTDTDKKFHHRGRRDRREDLSSNHEEHEVHEGREEALIRGSLNSPAWRGAPMDPSGPMGSPEDKNKLAYF
jgi:hypothetical protein